MTLMTLRRSTAKRMLGRLTAAVALVACGDGMEGDADMNAELDRVFDGLSAMDRELTTHAAALSSAEAWLEPRKPRRLTRTRWHRP